MKNRTSGGYVGLIILLVSIAVVALLFVRIYFTPTEEGSGTSQISDELQPLNSDGSAPETEYDRLRSDVDAARGIQNLSTDRNTELEDAFHSLD